MLDLPTDHTFQLQLNPQLSPVAGRSALGLAKKDTVPLLLSFCLCLSFRTSVRGHWA